MSLTPAAAAVNRGEPPVVQTDNFWRQVPQYRDMTPAQFLDPLWQRRETLVGSERIAQFLHEAGHQRLSEQAMQAAASNPMAARLTPTVLASMDWTDLASCPVRRQFIFLSSEVAPDHPGCRLDSLDEQGQSTHGRVVQRYPGRALLLALDTCPIYCGFCTRSYVVGPSVAARPRGHTLAPRTDELLDAAAHIGADPGIEDVIVSGGDVANLGPKRLGALLDALTALPQLRRIRLGTRGFLANPLAIQPGGGWFNAVARAAEAMTQRGAEFAIHVHFNSVAELNPLTVAVLARYRDLGTIRFRNQSVCMRGVNHTQAMMMALIRRLLDVGVEPYYVYQHDLVPGCEHLRTSVREICQLEQAIRGQVAGCDTPDFVVDLPGGGGKRAVHSFETYDRRAGVATYRSPIVAPGRQFHYFDPTTAG